MTILVARILRSLFHPKAAPFPYIPQRFRTFRQAEGVTDEGNLFVSICRGMCAWGGGQHSIKEHRQLSPKDVLVLTSHFKHKQIRSLCKTVFLDYIFFSLLATLKVFQFQVTTVQLA